jgi:hypothetical protein
MLRLVAIEGVALAFLRGAPARAGASAAKAGAPAASPARTSPPPLRTKRAIAPACAPTAVSSTITAACVASESGAAARPA